jgi:hypothetical protein
MPDLLLPVRMTDSRFGAFTFDKTNHVYRLGARVLPGITGTLVHHKIIDPTYYTEEGRTRGTHVHQAIHYLNRGTLDWAQLKDKYVGYVMAYEKFMREWNLKLVSFEQGLYHPALLFAGTPDLVGTVLDNVPAIVEIKTGVVPKWAALQTAAQALLVKAWDPQALDRRRFGITLNADGTYSKPKEFENWASDELEYRTLNSAMHVALKYIKGAN